mgnify:CR=1 FL=1
MIKGVLIKISIAIEVNVIQVIQAIKTIKAIIMIVRWSNHSNYIYWRSTSTMHQPLVK